MAGKLIKGVNDLETVNPDLAKEWNYTKNYPLTPKDVLPGSNKKVWWMQEIGSIIFEWEATVNSRNSGTGNPYLSNQKVFVGYNDLATTNPSLAKEWNYEKNSPLTPEMVTEKSKKKVWWIQNVNGHIFEWEATIVNRSIGNGNPFLVGVKVWKGYNDLATVNPKLAEEWDYEKNYPLTPQDVTVSSNKKVWWKYELDGHVFNWEATINNRNKNGGNPYIIGKKVKCGYNDLATTNPKLAEEWDYDKNGSLTPQDVTVSSNKKVWWKQEVNGHIFNWKTSISNRSNGHGNPYLSNKKLFIGYNDLATTNPELAQEWDYIENKGLTPQMVTPHSPKRVFWIGKCGHKWKSLIYNRVNGNGCPVCANEQQSSFPEQAIYYYIKKIYEDAVNRDKEILAGKELDVYIPSLKIGIEYDGPLHKKNVKRDIEKNTLCKDKGVKLIRVRDCRLDKMKNCICILRDNDNDKSLENAIEKICDILNVDLDIDIQRDRVCILNQYISIQKEKSLASEYPELAKEWNYKKNHNITPDMVLSGSHKKVWWIQEIDGIQFEWISSISHRVNGRGNPYTSNRKILKGYNDLATTHPKLAEEWNYTKNGNLSPDMIMAGSGKKVWWQKEVNGQLFEWEDSPNGRTRLNGSLSYPHKISRKLKDERNLGIVAPHLVKESEVIINEEITEITRKMKCGMNATIILDNGYDDLTIQFEDGTIVYHCQSSNFYSGNVKNPNYNPKSILGQKKIMNCGMTCEVIEDKGALDITVRFEDGTIVEHRRRSSFKTGMIANPKLGLHASQKKANSILGEKKMMNCGMMCEVIEDKGALDITVRFEDGTVRNGMRRDYFRKGLISNLNFIE